MEKSEHRNAGLSYFSQCLLFLLLSGYILHLQAFGSTTGSNPGNDTTTLCLSQDEMILYNLVNDFRKQHKLAVIPLSRSLSIVAKVHIDDLLTFDPQAEGCNLHSWSKSGKWSACCIGKDPLGTRCMNRKPEEITGYTGNGFELIFWDEKISGPNDAYSSWIEVEVSKDMLLNQGKWQSKKWNAMGVGIKHGYAILWLGDKKDFAADISICGSDTLVQSADRKKEPVVQMKTVKLPDPGKPETKPATHQENKKCVYIVIASLKTEKQAIEKLSELKTKGYTDAILVPSPDKFRISAGCFTSDAEVKSRLKELRPSFPDCWILRP